MQIRKNQEQKPHQRQSGPIQVSNISDIPLEATPQDIFRLTVEVDQIDERETKDGSPYYFLQCLDEENMAFSVVVWSSQYARLRVKEGAKLEIDIRVPKEGYSAFNLA